jgi:hypothetical protein
MNFAHFVSQQVYVGRGPEFLRPAGSGVIPSCRARSQTARFLQEGICYPPAPPRGTLRGGGPLCGGVAPLPARPGMQRHVLGTAHPTVRAWQREWQIHQRACRN